jgi:predicted nuclease of predicted toxin-antitoxin system
MEGIYCKIYLDEDIDPKIAELLQNLGYDVLSTQEAKMSGSKDEEQLEFATSQRSVLFTFNIRHFAKLHNEYIKKGEEHYGILVAEQIKLQNRKSELLRRIKKFLDNVTAEEMKNNLKHLEEFK